MNGERRIAGFVLACLVAGDAGGDALAGLAEPLRAQARARLAEATDPASRAALLAWARAALAPTDEDAARRPVAARAALGPGADPDLRRALLGLASQADPAAERAALEEAGWPA